MSSFKRSLLSLFVILAPTIAGAASSVMVRCDAKATLPCPGVTDSCGAISWTFQKTSTAKLVSLVQNGVVAKKQASAHKLLPNCSLLIQKATEDQAGLYSCSHRGKTLTSISVSVVKGFHDLHFIGRSETCLLSSPQPSRFNVRSYLTAPGRSLQSTPDPINNRKCLRCEVVDRVTGQTWNLFYKRKYCNGTVPGIGASPNAAPQTGTGFNSGRDTATDAVNFPSATPSTHQPRYAMMLYAVIALAVAALLALGFVIVLCCKFKAKPPQSHNGRAEELHYSTVNFGKRSDHSPKPESEASTVVYSAVRTAAVPPQTDPLYATVNKPKKTQG